MKRKQKTGVDLDGTTFYYEDLQIRPTKLSRRGSTRLASITKLFSTRTNGQGVK